MGSVFSRLWYFKIGLFTMMDANKMMPLSKFQNSVIANHGDAGLSIIV